MQKSRWFKKNLHDKQSFHLGGSESPQQMLIWNQEDDVLKLDQHVHKNLN